jgi:hypothetical protein
MMLEVYHQLNILNRGFLMDFEGEINFSWLFNVNIALLFISGCWTLGSLMITAWGRNSGLNLLLSSILFSSIVLANISFLTSMIFSIMGIIQVWKVEKAKSLTGYALITGIFLLALSLLVFGVIIVINSSSHFINGGFD